MGVFIDINASLLKFCTDFIQQNNLGDNWKSFDFDSHASINDWPDYDLLGIGELSIENSQKVYYTTCYIAVCTRSDDANLKRLRPAIDKLFTHLKVGETYIQVLDSLTGKVKGNLVVMEGVEVMPVARTETRPMQMIGVMFGSTFLVPP